MPFLQRTIPCLCAALAATLAATAGCARSPDPERPGRAEERPPDSERAALPHRILELPGGSEISWEAFVQRTRDASAVCVGETHSNPHHHWAQLQVVKALLADEDEDAPSAALGMEMFQKPFQGVLDDYAARRIDEETMLARTGWEQRWGYDYELYRPMVEAARARGLALLALNAPRELVRKVSREGLSALTPSERDALPELDLDDPEHEAWFADVMEAMGDAHDRGDGAGAGDANGHGETSARPHEEADDVASEDPEAKSEEAPMSADERLYAAQVIWDETMAEVSAGWLAGGDDRRIVLLAGNGHCHESAIISRIERRGDYRAASVRPIIDASDGRVADLVANPRHDFLFVMEPPEGAGH